ncbi:MAG: hypothetical protein A2066_04470 [Bacteroidetes bacterium GWB2_41_8]|nr:MAG: hypothetical protein A2066_04470 [Bacteroidetes bacterium GWB2_41_8]
MQTFPSRSEIKLKNAVQFLGDKRRRYFSSGYKKVNCKLSNYQYSDGKLSALLKPDWGKKLSIKNSGKVALHIGSIEGALVAFRMLELFLACRYNLTAYQISACSIRKIEFRTRQCEQGIDLPFNVEVSDSFSEIEKIEVGIYSFNILVGNFHFAIEVDLKALVVPSEFSNEKFTRALLFWANQYYTLGYKSTYIDVVNLVLNLESRTVVGISKVRSSHAEGQSGLGICNRQGLTFIDFLSISGQLTQILLYQLENITREESNNMWVRSLIAEFCIDDSPPKKFSKAHFSGFSLVKLKEESWRAVTAQFEIGNIKGTAKVCHIVKPTQHE